MKQCLILSGLFFLALYFIIANNTIAAWIVLIILGVYGCWKFYVGPHDTWMP